MSRPNNCIECGHELAGDNTICGGGARCLCLVEMVNRFRQPNALRVSSKQTHESNLHDNSDEAPGIGDS